MVKSTQVEHELGSPFDRQGTGVVSDTRNGSVHGSGSVGTLNTAAELVASTLDSGSEQVVGGETARMRYVYLHT